MAVRSAKAIWTTLRRRRSLSGSTPENRARLSEHPLSNELKRQLPRNEALIGPHLEGHRVLGLLFVSLFEDLHDQASGLRSRSCTLNSLLSAAVRATERATPDDTARFLAGLRPSPGSPLNTLTKSAVWQRHAALFDTLFELKDRTSLSKIRIFATKEISQTDRPLLYFLVAPTSCMQTPSSQMRQRTF